MRMKTSHSTDPIKEQKLVPREDTSTDAIPVDPETENTPPNQKKIVQKVKKSQIPTISQSAQEFIKSIINNHKLKRDDSELQIK